MAGSKHAQTMTFTREAHIHDGDDGDADDGDGDDNDDGDDDDADDG